MIHIRHAEPDDYHAIHKIHCSEKVFRYITQDPFPSLEMWRKRLAQPREGFYNLLACHEEEIVGQLGLGVHQRARRKHSAALGMAVRDDWQAKGVGSRLLAAAVDLADNWLNMQRLELKVMTDNEAAIALYKKYDFVVEGTLRSFIYRAGQYVDVYTMARLKGVHSE